MKRLIIALCFVSSFATATEIEEIVVTARQLKIIMPKVEDIHVQNVLTKNWYYSEAKQKKEKRAKA